MCVLVVKPANVSMPSYEDLKAMYNRNPHGCGFATPSRIYKTMSFAKFVHELDKVEDSEPCIIHLRLATHGSIGTKNCHPFKGRLADGSDIYFAHNGILDINAVGDMTDSETAFKYRFIPVANNCGLYSRSFDRVVNDIIGYSKFAFLHDGEVRTYGHFTEYKGLLCSNMLWYRPSHREMYYQLRHDFSLAL